MSVSLTHSDVSKLLSDPSPQARVDAASKIAIGFNLGVFSDSECKLAEEIFRIMVSDAEVRVREAIAVTLKENRFLPYDVAQALANDVNRVSLPVLKYSEVLTDDDLLEIIRNQDEDKQIAIAERFIVSEIVADALVDSKSETVVSSLVANEGARISEASFIKAVDALGESEKVQTALVGRSSLPVSVAEKLVAKLSHTLCDALLQRHELTPATAMDLLVQTRERATLSLSAKANEAEIRKLVKQLHHHGRLTCSLVLRALCLGDIGFFEAALSELANIPLANAQRLIHDPGQRGLEQLWLTSELPKPYIKTVHTALKILADMNLDGPTLSRHQTTRKLIEQIIRQVDTQELALEPDDRAYLTSKAGGLPADSAPGHH